MDGLPSLLGDEIEDPDEECFLLVSSKPDNRDLGFVDRTQSTVSVSVNSQDFLIHQSPSLLTSSRPTGTTGAVLWKVTPLLASWLTHPANTFTKHIAHSASTVVELGAGISGVLALALAPLVSSYIATDQEYCLKLLRKNILENSETHPETPASSKGRGSGGKKSKRPAETPKGTSNVTVLPLDWQLTQVSSIPELKDRSVGLVIAADCIYNESLVRPLVDTMAELSTLNKDTENEAPTTFVLVAQELRSPDVLEAFMTAFCEKFRVWRLPDSLYDGCGDGGCALKGGGGYVVHLVKPYCTQILGDLGADVIKVEHVTRGDDTRAWGPPYAPRKDGKPGSGESAYFLAVNRNKRSLALDFKTDAGQAIVKELARKADVLVENYLPDTLAKYGLDYPSLSAENKKLIYASITGYGQTGPYKARAGYDVMVEAEMGLMHITGQRDGPPVKVGVAVTDLTTGLYTSNAILAALLSRSTTGQGQHIDMSLSDCQVATLANIASSVLISGQRDSGRWGTAHPSIVPYEAFPTSDGDILLGGGNDRLFGIMCDRMGHPEWAVDERFATNEKRVANRHLLVSMIEKETGRKTTKEWLDIFEGSGMPYAAVNDVHDTLTHEHARGMVKEVEHETCGPMKLVNTPFKFSNAEASIRRAPPVLGQDTNEILEELGFTSNDIQSLRSGGVIA
ncbi:Succinate--hydroxymethylglutarate CoA-transferase [Drechslerella dactyloides]|uniref:Succinate--hydroxymethylglutarate CoA-transferase n=1 Tax=Drechslerella dactyloides TaxID=74499 RepID=A0AAD6IUA1_DREDA|nr:Succinate--hydroxymethylglutarate CoA-transferase [Drechslerella dactyloides]